jgi:peptidoglycan/xylan/chitin deacetylase (PgdA/CDA1 family)
MINLWHQNTPRNFWLLKPDPPKGAWFQAYQGAFPALELNHQVDDIDTATYHILGEGQYGSGHWKISPTKMLYYTLKPILPYSLRYALRRKYKQFFQSDFQLGWPIEDRYVRFQFEIVRQLLITLDHPSISFRHFWPEGYRYAFVLTHDIETDEGQAYVRKVADMEERFGFRSSFNFVPEYYELDIVLMQELRERGFEIGVHGLKHDGKLYNSKHIFMERSGHINRYLKEFNAVGFRSPLTMRNPEWMQALEIEYDLSFFDTDPYEPMPGGCMSIWPFIIGKFVELPYTLAQDCTLAIVLGETTPRFWLQKVDFVEQNCGMALLNAHPDYLLNPKIFKIYAEFLARMKERNNYWHALPREVARWWRKRIGQQEGEDVSTFKMATISIDNGQITITC